MVTYYWFDCAYVSYPLLSGVFRGNFRRSAVKSKVRGNLAGSSDPASVLTTMHGKRRARAISEKLGVEGKIYDSKKGRGKRGKCISELSHLERASETDVVLSATLLCGKKEIKKKERVKNNLV